MDSRQLLRPPVLGGIAAAILLLGALAYVRREDAAPVTVASAARPSASPTQRTPAPQQPEPSPESTPTPAPTPSPSPAPTPIPTPRFVVGSATEPASRHVQIDGFIELVEAPDENSTRAEAAEMIRLLGGRELILRSVTVNYGPVLQATSNDAGEFSIVAEMTPDTTELGLAVSSTILDVEGGEEHFAVQIPEKGEQVSVSIPMVFAVKFLQINEGQPIGLADMQRPEILSEMRRLLGGTKEAPAPAP